MSCRYFFFDVDLSFDLFLASIVRVHDLKCFFENLYLLFYTSLCLVSLIAIHSGLDLVVVVQFNVYEISVK